MPNTPGNPFDDDRVWALKAGFVLASDVTSGGGRYPLCPEDQT